MKYLRTIHRKECLWKSSVETAIDGSLVPGQKGQPGGTPLWDKKTWLTCWCPALYVSFNSVSWIVVEFYGVKTVLHSSFFFKA